MKPPEDLGLDRSDFDGSHKKKLLISEGKLPSIKNRNTD
jgi:hypothetical protein